MVCFYLKEIRIIKSEIICFKNNTHFWRNYSNYSNFFPKYVSAKAYQHLLSQAYVFANISRSRLRFEE